MTRIMTRIMAGGRGTAADSDNHSNMDSDNDSDKERGAAADSECSLPGGGTWRRRLAGRERERMDGPGREREGMGGRMDGADGVERE